MDISQRFGEFRQLSPQLCSYWYIDTNLGLVIDNIHNEGSRTVQYTKSYDRTMRILTGLRSLNEGMITTDVDFVSNGNKIAANIAPKQQYTFMVRVNRGEDL